jgi:branched-chain amino acid aminotransferase
MTRENTLAEKEVSAKRRFGRKVSPHMLIASYRNGEWSEFEIVPFQNLSMAPTAMALHYGQTIFEGMKAFKRVDGKLSIFRIKKHYDRFCASAERMCMPVVPYALFRDGIVDLVKNDINSVPDEENSALYIRPFIYASEEHFGAKVAEEYKFVIFTGAVENYYDKPLNVKVEDHYIRAAKGGVGYAKCGGNYGGAFYATELAKKEGFDQVIWTDGSDQLYMQESGTMNLFFMINDVLITPDLGDTILDGITRESVITTAREWGIKVEERSISAYELMEAAGKGLLQEAFGCGTAAVAVSMASITIKGKRIGLPAITDDSFCTRIRQYLTDLRRGVVNDEHGWITTVN